MKVGMLDVDGKNFPNIAQMKISAWHKSKGDKVEIYDPFSHYDRVYKSKVFGYTPDYQYYINADEVIAGGTGYAVKKGGEDYEMEKDKPLPDEIEHICPDYSLYGVKNTAYGFLSRGCPRGCSFCIVGKKEGLCSRKVSDLKEFWNGERDIVLCDPNILACRDCGDLLEQLVESGAWIDFNQGLDARVMTEWKAELLGRVKTREIHFAWDDYKQKDSVLRGLEMYAKYSKDAKRKQYSHRAVVYTLTNFDTTMEQDLERIYTLRDMGFWAYVMIYDKQNAPHDLIRLQRWCNNRYVFAQVKDFKEYKRI